jgi:metal-responsive CopG/Arc/MetJ family transcriptional regulator
MSGQVTSKMSEKVIYVRLPTELVDKIDRLRQTPRGTLTRQEFLENLIRKALERNIMNEEEKP